MSRRRRAPSGWPRNLGATGRGWLVAPALRGGAMARRLTRQSTLLAGGGPREPVRGRAHGVDRGRRLEAMSRPEPEQDDRDALQLTARGLRIDRVTGEVVGALRDAGIASLLIKGPVLARRLYDDGAARPYIDSDLLVGPPQFAVAEDVLVARGFERVGDEERVLPEWARHSHELMRPQEGICVELHWRLMHYGAPPQVVWEAFTRNSARLSVGGVLVDVPADPLLALHTAVHVAEHGAMRSPAEDLSRALDRFPFEVWLAAAELARELDVTSAMAAGLWLLEQGRPMAEALGLGPDGVAAFALERVSRAESWREKARLALGIAFPTPEHMRSFNKPLARFGTAGLAAAYAWRPIELSAGIAPALMARRRARSSRADGR